MEYALIVDLINRLGNKAVVELTNPNVRATEVNAEVAKSALSDGQGLVDSYIGQRVSLPLAIVPPFIKTLTLDLAIYYLQSKLISHNKESSSVKLYDEAIKHLERFAKGETSLGLSIDNVDKNDLGKTDKPSQNKAEITSSPRRNTRTILGKLT